MRVSTAVALVLVAPGLGGCLICNCLVGKPAEPVDFTAFAPGIIASLSGSWGGSVADGAGWGSCPIAGSGRLSLGATGPTDCMAFDGQHPRGFADPSCTAAVTAIFPLTGSLHVDNDDVNHRWRLVGLDEEWSEGRQYGEVTFELPVGFRQVDLSFEGAGSGAYGSLRWHRQAQGQVEDCEMELTRLPDDDQPGPAM